MEIRSLGFRTDLIFHRVAGEVFDRGNYVVVRTPANTGFFWGNLLYFPTAPKAGDQARWDKLFREEFRDLDVHHRSYAWEGGERGVEFPGFTLEPTTTMTASSFLKPKAWNPRIEVRPLVSDADFEASFLNQVSARAAHFQEEPYKVFVRGKQAGYKPLLEKKQGFWMGAFLDGRLAGDLGIFAEDGLARFQNVVTHPEFQRQGVCSTLVYESCLLAQKELGARDFLMEADPEYHAARIYESVGFRRAEIRYGLNWFDRAHWSG